MLDQRMKIILKISTLLILFVSCNSDRIKNLESQITSLQQENQVLKDSINQMDYSRINSSRVVMIPFKSDLKLNESNRFMGLLFQDVKFPEYNLYEVSKDSNGQIKKRLVQEKITSSKFYYDSKPHSLLDNSIELVLEFDLDSIKTMLPASISMD